MHGPSVDPARPVTSFLRAATSASTARVHALETSEPACRVCPERSVRHGSCDKTQDIRCERWLDHPGCHQKAPGANLLRAYVRNLLGRRPPGGRAGRAADDAGPAHAGGPDDARRPRYRRPPVNWPRRWTGGVSRAGLPSADVPRELALVHGRAPDHAAPQQISRKPHAAHLPRDQHGPGA
jgi:hypothetical protein